MGQKVGYWFEDQIKAALKRLQEREGVYFHRFQDSKAAGNITAAAPADFLVASGAEAQLWECKASETHFSLSTCLASMVDTGQAAHSMWWEGNGLDSWYLFYSDKTGMMEAWSGYDVAEALQQKAPLLEEPLRGGHIDEIDEILRSLLP